MQGLISRYKSWRHGHGFGIHSPFAYSFITEVLRQRNAYYAYSRLPADKRLQLLFRTAVALKAQRATVLSSTPELIEQTLRLASSKIIFTDSNPDFIFADLADIPVGECVQLLNDTRASAVIFNGTPEEVESLTAELAHGMVFDNNRSTAIVAALPHLPRQNFKVKF